MNQAGAVSNHRRFVTAFTLPYLLFPPYANLQSKVGFIYGSFAVLAVLFTYFCIPDVHGRTLEEIEELFAMNIPLRQFRKTKTTSGRGQLSSEKAADEDEGEDATKVTSTPPAKA